MSTNTAYQNPLEFPDRPPRREFLYLAASATAAVGAATTAWPLIDSFNPSADTAALATVEVALGPIQPGQRITVKWRGHPVFIDRRTPDRIAQARAVDMAELKDPEPDDRRAQKAEWLIVIGVCTHLGCVPLGQGARQKRGGYGGWFCSCHGSEYDTSGRIRRGPAPKNLIVPPYLYLNEHTVRIG